MKKVEISRINIQIGDREISLTLDEARQLRDKLNDALGKTEWIVTMPVNPPYPPKNVPYWRYDGSSTSSAGYLSYPPDVSGDLVPA